MSSGRNRRDDLRATEELEDFAADLQSLPLDRTPEENNRAYAWVMLATTLLGGPGPFMRWMVERVPFPGELRWSANEVETLHMGRKAAERAWKRWNQLAAESIVDLIQAGVTPEEAIRGKTGGVPNDTR